MTYETIRYETSNRVATITLNRPERLNAINHQMIDDLNEAYRAAEEDPDVWTLIITGTGRALCTGADVGSMPGASRRAGVQRGTALPGELPGLGYAPGGNAAVLANDEADHLRRERDLLRRRPRPRHHR